ncbi:MAG: Trm112 family protein [Candidatus Bathyarchaeota archaeon]|jgi:uncharacterized protein YbaR (Trm112 family)
MKPWLLNILACPIDKHHPLEAYFFSWETHEEDIIENADNAGLPEDQFKKNYKQLSKQLGDGTISPQAIRHIKDASGSEGSERLLAVALDALSRLEDSSEKNEGERLEKHSQDIDTLHRYLNQLEVETGLLVCSECGRWYPIGSSVETIPEMLPDDLREEKKDLEWMKKWRKLIPEKILEGGRPFNLKDNG